MESNHLFFHRNFMDVPQELHHSNDKRDNDTHNEDFKKAANCIHIILSIIIGWDVVIARCFIGIKPFFSYLIEHTLLAEPKYAHT